MKKSALSTSLLMALVATTVVGCGSDVKKLNVDGKDVIFTVDGQNYFVDDLFSLTNEGFEFNLFNSAAGGHYAFEAIQKAVIKTAIDVNEDIKAKAELAYEEWEDEIKANAQTQGVSFKELRDLTLVNLGYSSTQELMDQMIYEQQVEQSKTNYYSQRTEPKYDSGAADGTTLLEKYADQAVPYNVRHILVGFSGASILYKEGIEITALEAKQIGTVCNSLALGKKVTNKWAALAENNSLDGSNVKAGDIGIMDIYGGWYSEFQYGIYTYELASYRSNPNYANAKDRVKLSPENEERLFGSEGLYPNGEIPTIEVSDVCSKLVKQAEEEPKNYLSDGTTIDKTKFPRNIIFDENFNTPRVQLLTLSPSASTEEYPTEYRSVDANNYVVDENGNPILIVRSQSGIHFISVEWSALKESVEDTTKYYMYKYDNATDKKSYVEKATGYVSTTVSDKANDREAEIAKRVSTFIQNGLYSSESSPTEDSTLLDYEIFNYYMNKYNVQIVDENIKNRVEEFVANRQASAALDTNLKLTAAWETYINKVERTEEIRDMYK